VSWIRGSIPSGLAAEFPARFRPIKNNFNYGIPAARITFGIVETRFPWPDFQLRHGDSPSGYAAPRLRRERLHTFYSDDIKS